MPQLSRKRRAIPAWSAVWMLLLLSSCAAPPQAPAIPAALTEPCARPELNGDTYADIIRLAARQRDALEECSERLRSIRTINEDIKK